MNGFVGYIVLRFLPEYQNCLTYQVFLLCGSCNLFAIEFLLTPGISDDTMLIIEIFSLMFYSMPSKLEIALAFLGTQFLLT